MTMAAAGQGQASGGDAGQGEGQGQQGGDVGQLQGLLEAQGQSLEEMRTFLASNPWQQQSQQEGEETGNEPIDLSFLDDPALDQPTVTQRLNETLNGVVDQRAQALMAPMQERMENM